MKYNSALNLLSAALMVLLAVVGSYAQRKPGVTKGYIVINGAKVTGEIQTSVRRNLQSVCSFRKSPESKFIDYTPGQVDSLFVEGEGLFVSRSVKIGEDEPASYFLHVLVHGKVTLLDVVDKQNKLRYFVEKDGRQEELKNTIQRDRDENGAIVKRSLNEYKRTLARSFGECAQSLEQVDYFERDLVRIVVAYNRCADPGFSYTPKRDPMAFSLGYLAGITTDVITCDPYTNYMPVPFDGSKVADISVLRRQDKFSSFTQGLTLDVGVGRKNKHVYMSTAILVTKRDEQTSVYRFKYTRIDVPFTIQYSMLLQLPVRPFFSAGIVLPIVTNDQSSVNPVLTYKVTLSGPPETTPSGTYEVIHPSDLDFNRLRLMGAAGLDIVPAERWKVKLMARVDAPSSVSRESAVSILMDSYLLSGSLSYRLN